MMSRELKTGQVWIRADGKGPNRQIIDFEKGGRVKYQRSDRQIRTCSEGAFWNWAFNVNAEFKGMGSISALDPTYQERVSRKDVIFSRVRVAEIIEEVISQTRYYMGKRQSAPYARAAEFVCRKHGLPVSNIYSRLISRGGI